MNKIYNMEESVYKNAQRAAGHLKVDTQAYIESIVNRDSAKVIGLVAKGARLK